MMRPPVAKRPVAPRQATREEAYDAMRKDGPTRKLYGTAAWRKRFRVAVLAWNPICSVIEADGQQCHSAAVVVHHLRDPKDYPEGFFDPKNVQAVCAFHHPGGQRGENPNAPRKYVPTILKFSIGEEKK